MVQMLQLKKRIPYFSNFVGKQELTKGIGKSGSSDVNQFVQMSEVYRKISTGIYKNCVLDVSDLVKKQ